MTNNSVKPKDEEPKKRLFQEPLAILVTIVSSTFALYYIYTATFGIFSVVLHNSVFIGATSVLVFLLYPAWKKSPKSRPSTIDVILIALSLMTTVYFIVMFEEMSYRAGEWNNVDVLMGVITVILCLEVTRRAAGWFLWSVTAFFVGYVYLGKYLPGVLGHPGFNTERMVGTLYSLSGIFGSVAGVFATYIFLFVIFGAFLQASGASTFFIDLPTALLGNRPGGPAKVAVVSSGLVGSISGSAAANVVITGTFTIPMMKSIGYKPHVAGAIEATASTGGGIMPPVMGAAAFLMAEFTGIPYWKIVTVSFVPAIMYYISVYVMVHMEAVTTGMKGVPREKLRSPVEILKKDWFYIIPLLILLYLLVSGTSPGMSAAWCIYASVAVSFVRKGTRMVPRKMVGALEASVREMLGIGATAGSMGIILGVVFLTGLGLKFSEMVLAASGGYLFFAILLVAAAAYVLGMGISISSSYIVLSVVAAPVLLHFGLTKMAAHLIIVWYCQSAAITPPVCLAAYAGAMIAGADPIKTGHTALKYAAGMLIIPFLFAYSYILFNGTIWQSIYSIVSSTIGLLAFSFAVYGYIYRRVTWFERVVLFGATFLLFYPVAWIDSLAILLILFVFLSQKGWIRRRGMSRN